MDYNLFDYKYNIEGYTGQDLFSLKHILFMSFLVLLMVVLCTVFRKAKKKNVTMYLKILSVSIHTVDSCDK